MKKENFKQLIFYKLLQDTRAIYYNKLKNPKYEAYKHNKQARTRLWQDCLQQTCFAYHYNQKGLRNKAQKVA